MGPNPGPSLVRHRLIKGNVSGLAPEKFMFSLEHLPRFSLCIFAYFFFLFWRSPCSLMNVFFLSPQIILIVLIKSFNKNYLRHSPEKGNTSVIYLLYLYLCWKNIHGMTPLKLLQINCHCYFFVVIFLFFASHIYFLKKKSWQNFFSQYTLVRFEVF